MIRLLFFAACEKVIIGDDHRASLISVMEGINLAGDAVEGGIPKDAVMPTRWTAISLWHRTKSISKPVKYEARVQVLYPSKAVFKGLDLIVPFTVTNEHMNFRNTFTFGGLPIGEEGIYHIQLSYRKAGAKQWTKAGDHPIRIHHQIPSDESTKVQPSVIVGKQIED